MAFIDKKENYMGLPMNIKRGNPIPLDDSSVWYSYDEMATYAQNGKTAYVGQILSLVDESTDSATAYIILNEAGELLEVGSATLGDNKTITLDTGVLGLKDFGSKYYRYVEETVDEETQETVPAHYVPQEVDEAHPWKAGLEPKVVSEDGQFVLGWYEPNPTTIEGVNTQIAGIQNTVDDLSEGVKTLQDSVGSAAIKDEEGNVTTPASGLFAELDKKASHEDVDTAIAAAVAELDHLKRTTVDSKDDINLNADDADQYIYMVPNGESYDEYMVIDNKLELIGNTSVDLSGKVDKQTGYSLVADAEIAKLQSVSMNAEMNVINSVNLDDFILTERHLSLNDIPVAKVENLQDLLDNKVDVVPGERMLTVVDQIKLEGIEEGAQVNFIQSVTSDFAVSKVGQLSLNDISIDKIEGLQSILDNKIEIEEGMGLSSNDYTDEDKAAISLIPGLSASIKNLDLAINGGTDAETGDEFIGMTSVVGSLQETVAELSTSLDKYVLQNIFDTTVESLQSDIGELDLRLQWKDI